MDNNDSGPVPRQVFTFKKQKNLSAQYRLVTEASDHTLISAAFGTEPEMDSPMSIETAVA